MALPASFYLGNSNSEAAMLFGLGSGLNGSPLTRFGGSSGASANVVCRAAS